MNSTRPTQHKTPALHTQHSSIYPIVHRTHVPNNPSRQTYGHLIKPYKPTFLSLLGKNLRALVFNLLLGIHPSQPNADHPLVSYL